jgi:hypothetical protein
MRQPCRAHDDGMYMSVTTAAHMWAVEYTSVHKLRRTSLFYDEEHAREFYAFAIDSAPIMYVSDVKFVEVPADI